MYDKTKIPNILLHDSETTTISEHFLLLTLEFVLFYSAFVWYQLPFLWILQWTRLHHHHHHHHHPPRSPLCLKKK